MKNKIIILLIFICASVYSFNVELLYKKKYYNLVPLGKTEYQVSSYNVLVKIDQGQTHRVLFNSLELSRLSSLMYVGDKYDFNGVELSIADTGIYRAKDLESGYGISFKVGKYDDIILLSALNFYNQKSGLYKEYDEVDLMASAIAVKSLLKTITGKVVPQSDLPMTINKDQFDSFIINVDNERKRLFLKSVYTYREKDNLYILTSGLSASAQSQLREIIDDANFSVKPTLNKEEKIRNYQNFIKELRGKPIKNALEIITNFVTMNITIKEDYSIVSSWTNPHDLYYTKRGDIKSVAFFYYWTLKELKFETFSFYVCPLVKRYDNEYSGKLSYAQKDEILLKNRINPQSSLDPAKYMFPQFDKAIYLVAVKVDDNWIYTTGKKWIDNNILKKERCCSDYMKNGCFYTIVYDDRLIFDNIPVSPSAMEWDVFYESGL